MGVVICEVSDRLYLDLNEAVPGGWLHLASSQAYLNAPLVDL
jgi:hypothetical protein